MLFGLTLDVDLKSQKFKKWRGFLIITGLSFKKSTYKKCSPFVYQVGAVTRIYDIVAGA